MARNDDITLPAGVWTQLTNANAAAVRVQNKTGYSILLKATNGTTAPTTTVGALEILPFTVLDAGMPLADLWPGVAGANRLWAFSDIGATVSVSHADA
jgi:hypothetical protein